MAVNQKPTYAKDWTTYGGKTFPPGSKMTDRAPDGAIASALESGLATDSPTDAKRAHEQELQRREDVDRQIATRSEKRESGERPDIPNLVRMPDGSYARAE